MIFKKYKNVAKENEELKAELNVYKQAYPYSPEYKQQAYIISHSSFTQMWVVNKNWLYLGQNKKSYLLGKLGVKGGLIHEFKKSKVYFTLEEAMAKADELNKEMGVDLNGRLDVL